MQKFGSWDRAMEEKDRKLSWMSPVERYMCTPRDFIHFQGSSVPQLQAAKRISRPVDLRAMDMVA